VEALRLPVRTLRGMVAERPDLAVRLLAVFGEHKLAVEQRLEALLTRPVESRVAEFLVDAAERHGVPESRGYLIGVKFTHAEISSFVGSTRETVTLILGDLKRRGLIEFDHRRVVVHDSEALRNLI
jgi:CRP-like cAMP-binding protein